MVDRKKLEALLQWMFQSIGKDLEALVIVDREGLVIASLLKEGINEEIIGGMAALVEPVLKRISSEFFEIINSVFKLKFLTMFNSYFYESFLVI